MALQPAPLRRLRGSVRGALDGVAWWWWWGGVGSAACRGGAPQRWRDASALRPRPRTCHLCWVMHMQQRRHRQCTRRLEASTRVCSGSTSKRGSPCGGRLPPLPRAWCRVEAWAARWTRLPCAWLPPVDQKQQALGSTNLSYKGYRNPGTRDAPEPHHHPQLYDVRSSATHGGGRAFSFVFALYVYCRL